jgi:hypothetical protein
VSGKKILGIVLVVLSVGITVLTTIGLWIGPGTKVLVLLVGFVGVWLVAKGPTKS